MHTIKTMDVTLRDGGHRTGFRFNKSDLKQIIGALDKAGIDYIEVGYRNGALPVETNVGCSGLCLTNHLEYCRKLILHAKMVVMAYPANITMDDLIALKACRVDLLRLCIVRGGLDAACAILRSCEAINLEVGVNFTHTSKYNDHELDDAIDKVSHYHPKVIYFADSNGSLHPAQITAIYDRYTHKYPITFGFHAHDNLGLAQANAIAALHAGAEFIDFSLSGLGKGIGNLRTEFFVAYLQAINLTQYKLEPLLPAANYVRKKFRTELDAIDISEFLRGINDD